MINFSDLAFFWLAFCTNSNILLTVLSPNSFVTLTFNTPLKLIYPLKTSSLALTPLGSASPVRAFVSTVLSPLTIIPV